MNGNVPVTLFNAQSEQLQVSINGGQQIIIPGTGPSLNWNPQQPSANFPSFAYGTPQPNVFGTDGPNQVQVSIQGSNNSYQFSFNIPPSPPVSSLQLYFFWGSNSTVTWIMLNSGIPIAQGSQLQTQRWLHGCVSPDPLPFHISKGENHQTQQQRPACWLGQGVVV